MPIIIKQNFLPLPPPSLSWDNWTTDSESAGIICV